MFNKLYYAQYRTTHRKQIRVYNKRYELAHPQRVKENRRLSYFRNKIRKLEYQRKYRLLNKEKVAANRRIWYKLNQEKLKEIKASWKLRVGITKQRRGPNHGLSKTKEYRKLYRVHSEKGRQFGGTLTIKTIQQVYEDNIKLYGTLTCYLCIKPIEFGDDHLEHKIPLSRGGTNEQANLGVAHSHCNCKKWNRTEEEYKTWLTQQVQQ